jgi:hypothetical protein
VSNGAPAAKESIPALDPGRLPDLPSQGLFVDEPGGVLLETTAGRAIGLLRGFSVGGPQSPSDTQFERVLAGGAFVSADPAVTVLFDRSAYGWILDVSHHKLTRLLHDVAPIAGGATVRAVADGHASTGWNTKVFVERRGKILIAGTSLVVIRNRYAATTYDLGPKPTEILDVATGWHMKLSPHCAAEDILGRDILATCIPTLAAAPSTLVVFSRDGSKRVLSTFPAGVEPGSASVSPNGKWILLYLSPNCGLGWTIIVSSRGGLARFVAGGGIVSDSPRTSIPPFSTGLGWTTSNEIVATIAGKPTPGCSGARSTGTYVIDPVTLSRTRSTAALASGLWGTTD